MDNNLKAQEIRQLFFDFFRSKGHRIVSSAPMVIKDDPTLMFTNAGMNQFKDIFLGGRTSDLKRVANSQKCLRVSGKHNDLEEVGHDTYHHTMFEMLGNWSFGDYFKKEAIEWGWEFLTGVLGVDEDRIYTTVFEGSREENVPRDNEAADHWTRCFRNPENRIIEGSKKDNFWEMGETGPCGPCSEIHVDIRDDEERKAVPGHLLVNRGHPLVIEIWNLVFIQYNRLSDGRLELLPARHVDTGMGFERLCMIIQGKKSNYDTDIFQSVIQEISAMTGIRYGENENHNIAMRVVADHLRAVAFSIADGQLPSNNKAGYVIRRILRRAVRYGYNHLGIEEPFIHKLVPVLAANMGDVYPELRNSSEQISKIIYEEESAFLRTLGKGLKMIEKMIADLKGEDKNILPGKVAFELYDTFGFPADLTQLILRENDMHIDMSGFEKEMKSQKERSREDAAVDTGDWVVVRDTEGTVFTGYDTTVDEVSITRYRKIRIKGKHNYQIVLDRTPFYAESGGQVGDTGFLSCGEEKITVLDTLKENNQILHITDRIVTDPSKPLSASVDTEKRQMTASNHTATHLLHFALRSVLGTHVEQKGSLVTPDRLRFDFSHFGKPDREELRKIEELANRLVREGSSRIVTDGIRMDEAHKMGAMALFGEKYGERVRVISFGKSVELCGGTHVENTGSIGIIKIISEGAIAAGVRRLEAITAARAEEYISEKLAALDDISVMLKSTGKVTDSVEKLLAENSSLRKTIEKMETDAAESKADELKNSAEDIKGIKFISSLTEGVSPDIIKHIAFRIRNLGGNYVAVLGSSSGEKASLTVIVSDSLVKERGLSAVNIIKEISAEINGGGGGQPFLATAGGKKAAGLPAALKKAREILLR